MITTCLQSTCDGYWIEIFDSKQGQSFGDFMAIKPNFFTNFSELFNWQN